MKPGLLYFHGFNTAPEPPSEKIRALKALAHRLGWDFLAPRLHYHHLQPGRPETLLTSQDFSVLNKWFEEHTLLVAAGSSLGGWLARRWPSGDAVAGRLLINPVSGPLNQLSAEGGDRWVNYVTGEAYTVPADFTQRLEATAESWPSSPVDTTLVLLDLADEVLDSEKTRARLGSQAEVLAFAGGSHRFEHMQEASAPVADWLSNLTAQ